MNDIINRLKMLVFYPTEDLRDKVSSALIDILSAHKEKVEIVISRNN